MTSASCWTAVRVSPSSDRHIAAVTKALFEAGSLGVHEDGSVLVTHFPSGTDLGGVAAGVRRADPTATVHFSPVEEIDWVESWKAQLKPQAVGRFVIVPPWLAEERDPEHTIIIEPGMAFGTGDHATTRGVLRLLGSAIRPGDTVADLGAGSAILSVAAAKLGASRVVAIELDPDAIPEAELNVKRNGVADRVHVLEGDASLILPLVGPVDLILANIVSSVLLHLLPMMRPSLADGGRVMLSGILIEERRMMLRELAEAGWQVLNEDPEDIWWSVSVAPE